MADYRFFKGSSYHEDLSTAKFTKKCEAAPRLRIFTASVVK